MMLQAPKEYSDGMEAAFDEFFTGNIYNITGAIKSFENDPPIGNFQKGFLFQLHQMERASK